MKWDTTVRAACLMGIAVSTVAESARGQTTSGDSTGSIVGIVLTKEGAVPLAYSVVSVPSLGRERFSNAEGVFTLNDVPAGTIQLRVRHLGYSPADLSVVVHAGRPDTIRVSLAHIAVRLTAMQVRAYPECKNPGVPKASSDSAFATVFDQLHQNAEQYRLLTDTYPFNYSVERTISRVLVNGNARIDGIDTLVIGSNRWTYKPGAVVTRTRVGRSPFSQLMMNVPTLINFADKAFLENHCFYNGGLETVDGTELLRVDFVAASRIKEPDVDGSMYLDPSTFQIRRSVLRLTKIPPGLSGLVEAEAVTTFGEILPSISVIADISSVNRFQANQNRPLSDAAAHERQRLLKVEFLKGMPGEDRKRPDADSRPAHRTGSVLQVRHSATPLTHAEHRVARVELGESTR